jgi:hypothetical protein
MWLISDFELTDQPWVGTGGATLATTREHAFEGYQSLLVTNRNGYPWQGAEHDLTGMVSPNTLYQIGAQVRVASNSSEPVLLTLKSTCAGMSPVYTTIDAGTATNTGWTPLLGAVTLPTCDLEQVSFYVEGPSAGVDLYIDDVFAFRFAFDPPELAGGFVVTTDWGSGYCVELEVQNNHTAATVDWSARFNLNGASIYAIWNLDATASAGEVTVTPNAEWSRVIPAGASSHSLGFCANRPSGGSSLPSPPLLGVAF